MRDRKRSRILHALVVIATALTGVAVHAAPAPAAPTPYGYCMASPNPSGQAPPMVRDHWGRGPFPTRWCVVDYQDGAVIPLAHNPALPAFGTNETGMLYRGISWFVCQKYVGDSWYAYTQGDIAKRYDGWGWWNAVFISGGKRGGPVPGLVNCSVYGI
jgi:hypothetical protein